MDKFSLDLVRDSFSQDVRGVLNRADEHSQAMLKSPVLSANALLKADEMPIFEAMGHHFHAIYGSSALLQVKSLSESARLLEDVAEAGDACLKDLDRQIRRTRAFAEICVEGIGALRNMLELELTNKADEAWDIASKLLERTAVREEMAERGKAAEPAPEKIEDRKTKKKKKKDEAAEKPEEAAPAEESGKVEFSFDAAAPEAPADAPAEPAAEAPQAEEEQDEFAFESQKASLETPAEPGKAPELETIQDELLQIFQQETRENLVALQGYLQTLQRSPNDAQAAKSLERIYHTLKGSAATVGLMSLSKMAANLQHATERVVEKEEQVTPELLHKIIEETNGLLKAGGLPEIVVEEASAMADLEAQPSDELKKIFVEEANDICQQVGTLLQQLADVKLDRATRASARTAIGGLFHRLKGSAVINGMQEVADEAARLQELAQSEGDEDPLGRELESGLQRLKGMAGIRTGKAAAKPPAPKKDKGEETASSSIAPSTAAPASTRAPSSKREHFAPVRENIDARIEPALWEAFEIESTELIDSIQKNLFALEESTQPKTLLADLFRNFHTLKGAANTTGLSPVGKMVHMIEDYLEELTEATILPPMKNLTGLLLRNLEAIRKNLREARRGYVETNIRQLEVDVAKLRSGKEEPSTMETATDAGTDTRHPSTITEGSKPGTAKGTGTGTGTDTGAEKGAEGTEAKFIRVSTERLDGLMNLAGELVVSRSRLNRRVVALRTMQRDMITSRGRLLGMVEGFRERYEFSQVEGRRKEVAMAAAGAGKTFAAAKAPAPAGSAAPVLGAGAMSGFTDLEMDKYEDVNILARSLREVSDDISELQKQINVTIDNFSEDSDSFSALVTSLQDEITRARMVPVDQLFMRLRLPIRDASEREKKDTRVVTVGEEVNLDKTIIDSLYLPMLHLVRNCVSHGVEGGQRRTAAGKDPVGTVTLSARQVSGQIMIEVRDDGGGLNLESLRSRGISMGLIAADTPLESPLVRDLIFVAGVSTREQAGDVAGRGLGMAVVRREVERLNGNIRVQSERGRGTTFTITLPLTLAISRALLIQHNKRIYAVPLHFAQRILDLSNAKLMESAEVQRIRIEDQYLSLHGFSNILKLETSGQEDATKGTALLLRVGDERAVVRVDAVVGQEEIVVKSMGDLLGGHPLFSGVTISGDGELILILDVPGLLESLSGGARTPAPAPAALPAAIPGAAAPETATMEEAAAAEEVPAAPAMDRTLRILFVDDSLSVRKVAEKFLQASGADVTLAVDGVDALAKMRTGMFDMVFTDLEMPRMHGYEFIREMRYIPQFKDIPVVVVTSRSGAKHRAQAQLVGATDYVTKPFTQGILQEKIDTYVHGKRGGSGEGA